LRKTVIPIFSSEGNIVVTRLVLGALKKMRNKTNSFVMSVCPPARLLVRIEHCAPTGLIFMKFDILRILRKSVQNSQVLLKAYKNKWYIS
jgi:hypothetical protein